MTDQEVKIKELTQTVLPSAETFVVDVEVKGTLGNHLVWVFLDTETGGITIDQCADVSNELSLLLDAHDLFSGRYILNVSSPGLDRPLKDPRQYPKNVGRKAKVRYMTEEGGKHITGKLTAYDGESIQLETESGEFFTVSLEKTLETKILPAW